jgi:hypothetical protein
MDELHAITHFIFSLLICCPRDIFFSFIVINGYLFSLSCVKVTSIISNRIVLEPS